MAKGKRFNATKAPRSKAARDGAIWLYGQHAVRAALANPARRCIHLLMTEDAQRALPDPLAAAATERAVSRRTEIDARLPAGAVHQGLALHCAPLPAPDLDAILADARRTEPGQAPPILVLDQVTDPRNLGAALRAAAAFKAAAIVVPDRRTPEATGALAKAASGALETVPLARVTNLARALETIKDAGYRCIGLDGDAGETLAASDLSGPIALVLGSEERGMRRLTREACDSLARIPISAGMESLNVATAAAIALYDLARRRPE